MLHLFINTVYTCGKKADASHCDFM